jgi:hypothetical protein
MIFSSCVADLMKQLAQETHAKNIFCRECHSMACYGIVKRLIVTADIGRLISARMSVHVIFSTLLLPNSPFGAFACGNLFTP